MFSSSHPSACPPAAASAGTPASAQVTRRDCAHCGEALLPAQTVQRHLGGEDRQYCCLGCAFIAEQLFLAQASQRAVAALVPPATAATATPAPGRHVQFQVRGMVCAACGLLIEHQLKRVPGVQTAQVDFSAQRVHAVFDPQQTSDDALMQTVERSGYTVLRDPAAAQATQGRARRVELLRMLLAWLAMMQVMMLAVPAYLAAPGEIAADIEQLLRLGQLVLTAPVLLFSAAPFFRAARNQIRMRSVGMDLPITFGVAAAFAASLWATLRGAGPVYYDSITMFVALVLASRWLQSRAISAAQAQIDAARQSNVLKAYRLRRGDLRNVVTDTVTADQLRAGELVLVPAGEAVPADGFVRRGASTVSQAWLTGEAVPIEKSVGMSVLAGSVNLEQPLVVEIKRAGEATSLAALQRLVDAAGQARPPIVELANRVALWFLWGVLAITVLTVVGWLFVDPAQALPNAIAVLVATCPCALSLAAPAAFSAAQSALAQRGVLTARSAALERLAAVDSFAFDKTGTLTASALVLTRILPLREQDHERDADRLLMQAASLESLTVHPFALAIKQAAQQAALSIPAPGLGQVRTGAGIEAVVNGRLLRIGRLHYALGLMEGGSACLQQQVDALTACLQREELQDASVVLLADTQGPLALFAFGERNRPGARALMDQLQQAGLRRLLLSGDRREPVQALARQLGLDVANDVLAQQTPDSKRALVQRLQAEGRRVAMLGDGINDAPVIAQADVSFAMASGATLAQTRADFVVVSERLTEVAGALHAARRCMRIVRGNLGWAFAYNLAVIPLAAFGFITPALAAVGMALSSLLVVLNALRARVF